MGQENLSNMGAAGVYLSEMMGEPCILKVDTNPVEANFYRCSASQLVGVNTPKLLSLAESEMKIELIPNKVTLEQLRGNPNTFQQLANLHQSKYRPQFPVKAHGWTKDATEKALALLNLNNSDSPKLRHLQEQSRDLFEHDGLIYGDTNEGNWGTRNNGELVLFDWERFGYGSPAIDLAPLVQGLGNMTDYEAIVEQYIKFNQAFLKDKLVEHLILAKAWIIVEVVDILSDRNNPEQRRYLDWYREQIPIWFQTIPLKLNEH